RAIQSPLICSYLVWAICYRVICLIRIDVDDPPYLKPLDRFLDRYLMLPASYMFTPFYFAMLLVVFHCRFRLHRVDGLSISAAAIESILQSAAKGGAISPDC